jgi:hypothetical protein
MGEVTVTVAGLAVGPPGFKPGTASVLGPCSCKAWEVSSASSGASRGQLSGYVLLNLAVMKRALRRYKNSELRLQA